jgi:hypothetical protein
VILDTEDFLLGAPEWSAPSLRSTPCISGLSVGDSDALGVGSLPRPSSGGSVLLVLELRATSTGKTTLVLPAPLDFVDDVDNDDDDERSGEGGK